MTDTSETPVDNTGNVMLPVGVGTASVILAVTGGMRVRLPVGSGRLKVEFTVTVTVPGVP